MCQHDAYKLHSHYRRIAPEPFLQLWEINKEWTGQRSTQTSCTSVEEPPKDYGETRKADWILQYHLRAQSPVEESGVGRVTAPPGAVLDQNQPASMSKC